MLRLFTPVLSMRPSLLFLCLVLAVGSSSELNAQTPQPPPSVRLVQHCRVMRDASRDVEDAAEMLHGDDRRAADGIVERAVQGMSDCFAVWELLAICEMLSPSLERTRVVAFVRARQEKYTTGLDPSITYLNQTAVVNPQQARLAESIRDKLRVLADLFRELKPQ